MRETTRSRYLEQAIRFVFSLPLQMIALLWITATTRRDAEPLPRVQNRDCTPTGPEPKWHLRPSVSKNGLPWELSMLPECAALLRPLWEAAPTPESPLLAVPGPKACREDRERAGIKPDERGRVADFHSLRYTFCKMLGGRFPMSEVKLLMRHLTLQMTADVYEDLGMKDVAPKVWQLPPLLPPPDEESGPTAA